MGPKRLLRALNKKEVEMFGQAGLLVQFRVPLCSHNIPGSRSLPLPPFHLSFQLRQDPSLQQMEPDIPVGSRDFCGVPQDGMTPSKA